MAGYTLHINKTSSLRKKTEQTATKVQVSWGREGEWRGAD